MTDEITIAVYNDKVKDYHRIEEPLEQVEARTQFMASLPAGGYVLDLGCGPGKSAAIMSKHKFVVDAVDASPAMIALANESYGINARLGTFKDISTLETYDGVWANFSLLHATAEEFPGLLTTINKSLKPGGKFYLGMKAGSGSGRDALGRFYTYYSEEELTALLRKKGFYSLNVRTGAGAGLTGTIDPWVTILSVKR